MIEENEAPARFALIPPATNADAGARLAECMAQDMTESIVGVIFDDFEQFKSALVECGFLVKETKKPWKNKFSETRFIRVTHKSNGAEFDILVNHMNVCRILNCKII